MLRSTGGFDHLPDDILMQILTRIPAQDIVDSTKFVCRKWREITGTRDFAYAHLHRSTPGLVFQSCNRLKPSTFMSLAHEEVQISDFIYRSRYGYFWTSCNGLILEPKVNDERELMITNPVTRHRFDLPPFFARPTIHPSFSSAIAHVRTELYKVVRVYHPDPYHDKNRLNCAILTVGVDNSWRLVDTHHLSLAGKLDMCPVVTEGFVHWGQAGCDSNKHILSLNMETEIITQILAPQCNGRYTYLPAGSSLSLLIEVGRLKWEVWEMNPLESGEWKKLPNIDLEAHMALLKELFKPAGDEDADCLDCCHLSPSGWLKFPEVIAFLASKLSLGCRFLLQNVVYNVETKDVSLYKADDCYRPILVHKNSLVRILS